MATLSTAQESVLRGSNAAYPIMLANTVALTANVADGDVAPLFYIPKNCLIYGGWMTVDDIDSGTEAVDIDLGWTANGGSATYDINGTTYTNAGASADPDGFINTGVLTGDAITDLLAAGSNYRPLPMVGGPKYFGEETLCQLEANAAAATFVAGSITVVLFGRIPIL